MNLPKINIAIKTKTLEDKVSLFFTLYFMFGLLFGLMFAYYYRWEFYGYFSPNFFAVVFTWPYQAIGFLRDVFYYGTLTKPI